MKDQAIVLQHRPLLTTRSRSMRCTPGGAVKTNIKPQVDKFTFGDGKSDLPAGRRPPGQPRLRHRPPELRDVELVLQPDAGADRPVGEQGQYDPKVYILPKKLDEEVARLHLEKIGVKLTTLTRRTRPTTSASRSTAPSSGRTRMTTCRARSAPAVPPTAYTSETVRHLRQGACARRRPTFSCVGGTREELHRTAAAVQGAGLLRRIVALRGDLPGGHGADDELRFTSSDLIAFIRGEHGDHFHHRGRGLSETIRRPATRSPTCAISRTKVEAGAGA